MKIGFKIHIVDASIERLKCMISLIIPVYNTEKLLGKCLESVINQTYSDMEIICIDDGSTDKSGQIIDEYAKKDDRIIVIHKENGGESSARNAGLLRSTGDYIGFMDCDDWIEKDMYETLVKTMEENDADMVAASWFKSYDDEEKEAVNLKQVEDGVFNRDKLLRYLYERDTYQGFAYMWDKLYKRKVLTEKNGNMLLFDENIQLGGDVIYLAKAALNCKKAVYVPKGMYHYYQRNKSGCHTESIEKRLDWIKSYLIVIDMFEREKIQKDILNYVKRFLVYHCSNLAELAYRQNDNQVLLYCQNIMKKYEDEYVSLNQPYPERILKFEETLQYRCANNETD